MAQDTIVKFAGSPTNPALDIRDMHDKYGFHKNLNADADFLQFRIDFIKEEYDELLKSLHLEDTDGFIDACIDLTVVIIGLLDLFGVDFNESWIRVHNANMKKERGNNHTRKGSGGVDLIKPEGWTSPSHIGNFGKLSGAISEWKVKYSSITENKTEEREAISVFRECIDLMIKKSQDYNSGVGGVLPSDYYPYGMISLYQMLHTKMMRVKSVMENALSGKDTNFESIEDSLKDLMVYSSFAVEYNRSKMRGQKPEDDLYGNLRFRSITGEDKK